MRTTILFLKKRMEFWDYHPSSTLNGKVMVDNNYNYYIHYDPFKSILNISVNIYGGLWRSVYKAKYWAKHYKGLI